MTDVRCTISWNATNLQKGGIYNHFDNKEEIAFAAFDYSFEKIRQRFRNALSTCVNNTEKLHAIIRVFASFHNDPVAEGGCPIFNTAVDSMGAHPKLQQRASDAINSLQKYIEIKIDQGKLNGEFRQDAISRELSSLIVLTMEGALIMSRVNNDRSPLDFAIKYLTKIFDLELIQ